MNPRLDKRTYSDILRLLEDTPVLHRGRIEQGARRHYLPDWSARADDPEPLDFGLVMNRLFAKLMAETVNRLNRIPEKQFAAFLEKVGVEPSAGSPARVPVTFTEVKNAPGRSPIPAGTRVATTQTEANPAITFETSTGFEMLASSIVRIISVDGVNDRWVELDSTTLGDEPQPVLNLAGSGQPVEHSLYLVHDGFLAEGEPRDVVLEFSVAQAGTVSGAIVWQRYDADAEEWVALERVTNTGDWLRQAGTASVRFDDFTGAAPLALRSGDLERPWVRALFVAEPGDSSRDFPALADLRIMALPPASGGSGALNVTAFANNSPIDFSNDFYPFGTEPRQNDAFYLSSPVFDNPDPGKPRQITLNIKLAPVPGAAPGTFPGGSESATLSWQYSHRNGSWADLTVSSITPAISNGEHLRPGSGTAYQLQFNLPDQFGLRRVNRQEDYWIRARISGGDFAADMPVSIEVRDNTGTLVNTFVVNRPVQHPPLLSLSDFSIDYAALDTTVDVRLDQVVSRNLFDYADHTVGLGSGTPQRPLRQLRELAPAAMGEPALYLGFDRPINNVRASLLAVLDNPALEALRDELASATPRLVWEYRTGATTWRRLESEDSTRALATSGIVTFQAGSDLRPVADFIAAEEHTPLYWLRGRVAGGRVRVPRRLAGVFPNSTWASSVVTNRNQVIGSGNGRRGQQLRLSRGPVLPGEVLRVREQGVVSDAALARLQEQEARHAAALGAAPVDLVQSGSIDANTGERSYWVRWHPVANDAFSGPQDRHYIIDRIDGTLSFPGMPLPLGQDNVRFDVMRINLGARARLAAVPGAVNQLASSLPYVSSVSNLLAAEGGSGGDIEVGSVLARGPLLLKHRGRAVTQEDFEALAREADPGLALARALPITNARGQRELGAITVIIVPASDEPQPRPSADLVEQVRAYLAARAAETIFSRVAVIGPDYVAVSVQAKIVVSAGHLPNTVAQVVASHLANFFHPLTGNTGRGFSFRARLHISEIYAFIESIDGVEAVESASFLGVPDPTAVEMVANQLVASGNHDVSFRS